MVMTMPRYRATVVCVILSVLTCGLPALAQSQQPEQQLSGSISGTIVDPTGGAVAGARVRLSRGDQSPDQEVVSGDDGQFSFADVAKENRSEEHTSELQSQSNLVCRLLL